MLSNANLAESFASGETCGSSNRMSITNDVLYSYAARIAIRDDDKFIISNRTSFLGGGTRSMTTSAHISYAYTACSKKKPIFLVDGWAERNKPEFFTPAPYKTVRGIMKGFATGMCGGWVGEWCLETRTKLAKIEIKDDKLYSGKDLIAVREYITSKCPCEEICGLCPKRFTCLTNKPLLNVINKCPHYLFYVVEKTEYEKLAQKLLQPFISSMGEDDG